MVNLWIKCTKKTDILVANWQDLPSWALVLHLVDVWVLMSVVDSNQDYIQWVNKAEVLTVSGHQQGWRWEKQTAVPGATKFHKTVFQENKLHEMDTELA